MVNCKAFTDTDSCINAMDYIQDVLIPNCLWCIGYQNNRNISECISKFDYCDDEALCIYTVYHDSLNCEEQFPPGLMAAMGIGVTVSFCYVVYKHALFGKNGSACICLISFAFLCVSLCAGFAPSPTITIVWNAFTVSIFVGIILFMILPLLLPLIVKILKSIWRVSITPVSQKCMALLVIVMFIVSILSIGFVSYEAIARVDIVSVITSASIIILGFDWAMLAFEHQTDESEDILIRYWYCITCKDWDLNVNNVEHSSENDVSEQQYPSTQLLSDKLIVNEQTNDTGPELQKCSSTELNTNAVTLTPSYSINFVGGALLIHDRAKDSRSDLSLIYNNLDDEEEEKQIQCSSSTSLPRGIVQKQTYSINSIGDTEIINNKKQDSGSTLPLIHEMSHNREDGVQLLIIQLVLYVLWMAAWIIWALLDEELEPCLMNIATVGPVLLSIRKVIQPHVLNICKCVHIKNNCCNMVIIGVIGIYLITFSVLSCRCNSECAMYHICVIVAVSLWVLFSFMNHLVHLKEKMKNLAK
eukprot:521724_1